MKDTEVLFGTQEKSGVGRRNFVDASQGWDSMNMEVIDARSWQKRTVALDWSVSLERIWKLAQNISDTKNANGSDAMMRYVMKRACLEWRARKVRTGSGIGQTNSSNAKKRMTGANFTNWNILMIKWRGSERR